MDKNDLNRRFAKLVCLLHEHSGGMFDCLCGKSFSSINEILYHIDVNPCPDFVSDPRLVLREMMKRRDREKFLRSLCNSHTPDNYFDKVSFYYFIDGNGELETTGLLCKAACEWMEKEREE